MTTISIVGDDPIVILIPPLVSDNYSRVVQKSLYPLAKTLPVGKASRRYPLACVRAGGDLPCTNFFQYGLVLFCAGDEFLAVASAPTRQYCDGHSVLPWECPRLGRDWIEIRSDCPPQAPAHRYPRRRSDFGALRATRQASFVGGPYVAAIRRGPRSLVRVPVLSLNGLRGDRRSRRAYYASRQGSI